MKKCLHVTVQVNIVWFQKISIPPQRKGFFSNISPPLALEIPIKLHTFLHIFDLPEPPSPRKFQSLLWGEYGYFLELHIN